MRVCFAVLHYDPRVAGADLHAYLDRVPIHRELPAQLAARGHEVHVVHLYPFEAKLAVADVWHHFVPAGWLGRSLTAAVERLSQRDPIVYQPAVRAIRLIRALRPNVVHFHGLSLTWNLFLLSIQLERAVPLLIHYHGGGPARNVLARLVQRFNVGRANRILFTASEQAEPFVTELGLDKTRVVEFFEASTTFRVRSRPDARRQTGIAGDPVFLWTGRLHPVKDPMTALRGFERIASEWRDARLYVYYLTEELLEDLQHYLAARPLLASQVVLRGRLPNNAIEAVYNSADYFLQASHQEVCGYAPIEAMATGVIPVLSDIPAFRALTDHGRFGVLFPLGDDVALARGVLGLPRDIPRLSTDVRERFETALSYRALGDRLDRIYREVVDTNRVG